jgi:hypothetical protein
MSQPLETKLNVINETAKMKEVMTRPRLKSSSCLFEVTDLPSATSTIAPKTKKSRANA